VIEFRGGDNVYFDPYMDTALLVAGLALFALIRFLARRKGRELPVAIEWALAVCLLEAVMVPLHLITLYSPSDTWRGDVWHWLIGNGGWLWRDLSPFACLPGVALPAVVAAWLGRLLRHARRQEEPEVSRRALTLGTVLFWFLVAVVAFAVLPLPYWLRTSEWQYTVGRVK
jgi:hypothetical protein